MTKNRDKRYPVAIDDLLIEFDEMDYCPMNLSGGNPVKEAIAWRDRLRYELDLLLDEKSAIERRAVEEFAEKLKEEVICNLSCKGTAINNTEEMKACTTMARQLLYRINRLLNEDYGFDKPLCASDQFKVESELIKKYKINELLKEYEDEKEK